MSLYASGINEHASNIICHSCSLSSCDKGVGVLWCGWFSGMRAPRDVWDPGSIDYGSPGDVGSKCMRFQWSGI